MQIAAQILKIRACDQRVICTICTTPALDTTTRVHYPILRLHCGLHCTMHCSQGVLHCGMHYSGLKLHYSAIIFAIQAPG